jgi:hypothetical protein
MAKLGVANHSLYLSMGAGQTASGAVAMCSATAAHFFHYSPVLTGSVASTAVLVTGVFLGTIYAARGAVMLTRAVKSYRQVNEFEKEFKKCSTFDDVIELMKWNERIDGYLDRRINSSCLQKTDENGNIQHFTPAGLKTGNKTKEYTAAEKNEHLERIDKGIYTEKLKSKISMAIAIAMIIGGILAVTLAVLSGGTTLVVVALASAIFFMSMEYIFITYDSSKAFEWLRDKLYDKPDSIQMS